jgi:hypothetical protein
MKALSLNMYGILSDAVKTHGTYNPSEISYLFEEQLTYNQYNHIIPFLQWCHDTGNFFGRGNYAERYLQWLATR